MLTQCPGCQTVFRVTSTILRAAHGQVRCGRCAQQFDAIAHLLDSEELERQESADPATRESADNPAGLGGLGHEDIILEGHRIEISGVYDRLSPTDGKSHLEHGHIIEEFNIESEQWENPFVDPAEAPPDSTADDTQPAPVEDGDEEENVTEVDDVESELEGVSLAGDIASLDSESGVSATPRETSSTASTQTIDPETDPDIQHAANRFKQSADMAATPLLGPDEALLAPAAPRRWSWLLASTALIILLAGQAVHHWRTDLARRPGIGPLLMRMYQGIGQELTPEWQVTAYRIKQWGIVSDPAQAGTLRVRASVTNEAPFAQPYPILRLTLEDRFGTQVGQRDFKPQEYLSGSEHAPRLLDPNAAANIDLAIVDPGPDAVGFQFDSCLLEQHMLVCAHDMTPRR